MYGWLTSRLPVPVADVLYAAWYTALLVLIYYFLGRGMIGFYYLHR